MRSGFSPSTIKVTPAPADRKGGPILSGKTPAYTKLSFTVQGQAALDGVVRMMQEFYHTPLLHEVRSLTLTKKGSSNKGDLDVNMTIEALMVTGAEKRDALLPDKSVAPPQVLAEPSRYYTDMLAKNIFTGVAAVSRLSEDRSQVLNFIKLTALWNSGRRWEATYYDQGKGGEEKRLTERMINEFSVADKYDNVLVEGKVVRLDGDGVLFESAGKYYRWTCGQVLGAALEEPLKPNEVKKLGLTASDDRGGDRLRWRKDPARADEKRRRPAPSQLTWVTCIIPNSNVPLDKRCQRAAGSGIPIRAQTLSRHNESATVHRDLGHRRFITKRKGIKGRAFSIPSRSLALNTVFQPPKWGLSAEMHASITALTSVASCSTKIVRTSSNSLPPCNRPITAGSPVRSRRANSSSLTPSASTSTTHVGIV